MNERQYDSLQNEGCRDGYNPYRDARLGNARRAEAGRPKTLGEIRDIILRQLEALDCTVAAESGTLNQAVIATLRERLKDIDAKIAAKIND